MLAAGAEPGVGPWVGVGVAISSPGVVEGVVGEGRGGWEGTPNLSKLIEIQSRVCKKSGGFTNQTGGFTKFCAQTTAVASRTGLKVKKNITWPHGLGYLTGCWRCGVKPKQYVVVLRSMQLLSPGSMGLAVVEVMLEWMPWN